MGEAVKMKTTEEVLEEVRPRRAVVYLRVSTNRQVHTDETEEDGYSLRAQREACQRRGSSATNSPSPLRYLREQGVEAGAIGTVQPSDPEGD